MSTATLQPNELAAVELAIADDLRDFYADPLGFVLYAYPWGQAGTPLQNFDGPDEWQKDVLRAIGEAVAARGFDGVTPVEPIRDATSSGHGIGKSTLVAWVVDWIMSTRPGCRGTITANTVTQLDTKTWAAIKYWTGLCITSHWFTLNASKMARVGEEENWFCTAQTCREENSEAFAGQHAASSTSFYIFDEASAVPDKIFEVAEGGLTDGEPHIYCFGNPTRNSGKFHSINFGADRGRWTHRQIDSRDCKLSNKALIQQWIEDYGEDSDFVRVRVRGLAPRADELQFIDSERVERAQFRQVEVLHDEPLVAGFDVSGGGSAWNVIRFRRGLDARSIAAVRVTGERGRDRSVLIGVAAELLRDMSPERRIAMMFVDSAFGAPIVERLHSLGFENVMEVNFGGDSPDMHFENQRAFMWAKVKEWLPKGSIDESQDLALGLQGPGYHMNKRNKLVLESKESMQKRGVASPDDADALALTFARPVAAPVNKPDPRLRLRNHRAPSSRGDSDGWMG